MVDGAPLLREWTKVSQVRILHSPLWMVGRVVEGVRLETGRGKPPGVRILYHPFGAVVEWAMTAVSKTVGGNSRGFESYLLRLFFSGCGAAW